MFPLCVTHPSDEYLIYVCSCSNKPLPLYWRKVAQPPTMKICLLGIYEKIIHTRSNVWQSCGLARNKKRGMPSDFEAMIVNPTPRIALSSLILASETILLQQTFYSQHNLNLLRLHLPSVCKRNWLQPLRLFFPLLAMISPTQAYKFDMEHQKNILSTPLVPLHLACLLGS